MIATATQIQLKGPLGFLVFVVHFYRVRVQLARSAGLVALKFNHRFQTLSVWENAETMKSFRNTGAHLAAMKATRKMGRAMVVSWETAEVPSWNEVATRLQAQQGATPRR
jgi:heme-degrading monooxygenase HmoA